MLLKLQISYLTDGSEEEDEGMDQAIRKEMKEQNSKCIPWNCWPQRTDSEEDLEEIEREGWCGACSFMGSGFNR